MATTNSQSNKSNRSSRSTSVKKRNTGSTTRRTSAKKGNERQDSLWSRYQDEIILVTVLVLSVLMLLSNFHLCGVVGEFINQAAFGLFGFLAYIFPIVLFFGVAFLLSNKQNKMMIYKVISSGALFIIFGSLLQMIAYPNLSELKFSALYTLSASGKDGGGLIGGGLAKLLCSVFDVVGTYIILIGVMVLLMMFISEKLLFAFLGKKYREQRKLYQEHRRQLQEENALNREEQTADAYESGTEDESVSGKKKRKPRSYTFPREEKVEAESSVDMQEVVPQKLVIRRGDHTEVIEGNASDVSSIWNEGKVTKDAKGSIETEVFDADGFRVDMSGVLEQEAGVPFYETELKNKFGSKSSESQTTVAEEMPAGEIADSGSVFDPIEDEKNRILNAKSIEGNQPLDSYSKTERPAEAVMSAGTAATGRTSGEGAVSKSTGTGGQANGEMVMPVIQPIEKPYEFPPIDLLSLPKGKQKGTSNKELQDTAMTLQKTLESFGVRVTVTNVSCGPAVTRYELLPERGVKVSRITGLADDIKLNLAAADIRIEAPIPGKAAVGIEVPNKDNSTVYLRELLESEAFKTHKSKVAFAVGKDIGGQTVVTDIAKMPHLLIAGATGSGKSVCINTLIMSLLYKADPNDVKLIMVDPKVVELSVYNGIPHLLIPVVTDPKKASGALNWAVMEMTERYQRFADIGVRDIKGYNDKIASVSEYKEDPKYVKMPQIVIIVDELADLMMVAPGEVEDSICRLAQLARAAGIHLIIATQRPSVNVITGLIKANIPSRIAFAVSSSIDSRTILDGSGAEKLLGKGDMLFFPTGLPKPIRVQGAFVSDKEVTAVVDFLNQQSAGGNYNNEVMEKVANAQPAMTATGGDAAFGNSTGQDEYFAEAGKFIIEKDKASIGMLQRVYKIGFNRAARIMDQLSDAGVVGPEEGTKPRKVLMTLEEFENYLESNQNE